MGTANTACTEWRLAEATDARNWIEDLHTSLTSPDDWLDTTLCVRWLLDNTGDKDETDGYEFQYSINAGVNWYAVTTTSSYVKSVDHPFRTDGQATSQELGSGTFDEGVWDDDGVIASYILAQGQESEHEHSFQYIGADCAGQTVLLRLAFDSAAALDGYTYSHPSATFALDDGRIQQSHFRFRTGDIYGLNVNDGWQAALDTDVTLDAEARCRLRLELEELDSKNKVVTLKLQYRKNAGTWTDLTAETRGSEVANPSIYICDSGQYADADPTTDVLSGSAKSFTAGTGEENNTLAEITLNNQQTEYEFTLVAHTFYDGPGQNVDGDYFEFRLVETDNTLLGGTYVIPKWTLNVPAGLIGGAYPEHPCRIGPYKDTNGNLYTLIEPADTDNRLIIIKSTDGGDSWVEVDGANRPIQDDVEGLDIFQDGDTLHILHIVAVVYYHRFRMSDHATDPDTWEITDEVVDNTITEYESQFGSLVVRSDTTIVAFYVDDDSPVRCRYKIRSSGGTWGGQNTLDAEAGIDFLSPWCVLGENNKTHVIYNDDTSSPKIIYHRSLTSGDSLTDREVIASDITNYSQSTDNCPYTPPVYYDSSGDEKVMIIYQKLFNGVAYHKVITDDGSPGSEVTATDYGIERAEGGNTMSIMDAAVDGTNVYVIYSEQAAHDIWRTENDDEGGWSTDVEMHDAVTCHWLKGNVFTHSAGNGGAKVLGYLWDNGSGGATGYIWYDEYALGISDPEVSEAESVDVSDSSLLALADSQVSETESVDVADSPVARILSLISEVESIGVTDTATAIMTDLAAGEAESIDVSDVATLALAVLGISRAETLTVGALATVSTGAEPDREVSEAESIAVSDSLIVALADMAASKAESITVADVVLAVMEALWAQKAESITAGDDPNVAVQGVTLGIAITEGEGYYTPKPIIVG